MSNQGPRRQREMVEKLRLLQRYWDLKSEGLKRTEIQERLGVSVDTLCYWEKSLNLKPKEYRNDRP